ncbi:MAG: hypothetical protein WCK84_07215 [Bacteroidota bacterium]
MRKLSLIILSFILTVSLFSQSSPHGAGFKVKCADCHNTTGWKVDLKTLSFNHNNTKFPLIGQHQSVNCKRCHTSLEFSKAGKECISCHTDIHNQTVGNDCSRCHTPVSWVVNNITEIHQRSRFPLVGPHVTADCFDCHTNASASLLLFGPLGVECNDCHQKDYAATTKPNHKTGGYSTNCPQCHNMSAFSWSGAGINHNFFPLTGGHAINNCQDCHKTPDYSSTSPICFSCHQSNFNATTNPSHTLLNFSTNCTDCHTTDPGWKPAEYREHDAKSFPIYSGKHNGEWSTCSDCHTNPASYAQFTCIDCHEHSQSEMDNKHNETQGYVYSSPACLGCHPTGSSEESFNHSTSAFPLTGAHATTECIKCHTNGYHGTSTICYNCHSEQFNKTTNPNHAAINISTECQTCHTTLPGWIPATFPTHDSYFKLAGAHVPIANDCATCHKGNYNNTPNLCFGCHADKYNQSTNPNHITSNFPTVCETCHSQTAWIPSNFNHNNTYPLTGAHETIANNCVSCHQGSYVNTPNTCAGCHLPNYNTTTNPNHAAINIPTNCVTCHTTNPNWIPATFAIHNNYYVLAGAHVTIANNCIDCHKGNYNITPNTCVGCHLTNYNQTTNPPHAASQFPTICTNCHTQNAWVPANWDHDNLYFPIYSGKHKGEWNACTDCHPNSGNYAVFTCTTSCHPQSTMNSEHQGVSGYTYNSAACLSCHPKGNGDKMMYKNSRND